MQGIQGKKIWKSRLKTILIVMCSRAPLSFSAQPEDSSPKHSLQLPACEPPASAGKRPLAGVYLRPNHSHYLLLHLRLLGVDVGISYLTILIPENTQKRFFSVKWIELKGFVLFISNVLVFSVAKGFVD